IQQLDGGYQIAKITVNGKRGVRNVRLNNSYPYLKEWLSFGHHPFPSYLNAALFCGVGRKKAGGRIGLGAIESVYYRYKKEYFPKLLEDPSVPEEDKRKIRDLLRKPWNPYVRRHTAGTEVSKKLKDSVLIDQYMGWSHGGKTRLKYQHYYSDDGIDAMLLADGLPVASGSSANGGITTKGLLLKPKQCPNCSESNKPDSRFCTKCKFVLSWDKYNEVTNESEEKAREIQKKQDSLEQMQKELVMIYSGVLDYFKYNEPAAWKNRVLKANLPEPAIESINEILQQYAIIDNNNDNSNNKLLQLTDRIKPQHEYGHEFLKDLTNAATATMVATKQFQEEEKQYQRRRSSSSSSSNNNNL
ncbi:MAG: zinc ribbon domain-containing protein, partial [Thermoproteota archaeon]|nr:zinc ribbon domain-containing protein [Thermoproteota archaeon]